MQACSVDISREGLSQASDVAPAVTWHVQADSRQFQQGCRGFLRFDSTSCFTQQMTIHAVTNLLTLILNALCSMAAVEFKSRQPQAFSNTPLVLHSLAVI